MSIQEKINRLAFAALSSAPASGARPQPVTFMLPFEKPRMLAIVPGSDGHRDARFGNLPREHRTAMAACVPAPWAFGGREICL